MMIDANAAITILKKKDLSRESNAKVVGLNPVQRLNIFSGLFSSTVMAAFASIIMTTRKKSSIKCIGNILEKTVSKLYVRIACL